MIIEVIFFLFVGWKEWISIEEYAGGGGVLPIKRLMK
jgi:hypothetical protein